MPQGRYYTHFSDDKTQSEVTQGLKDTLKWSNLRDKSYSNSKAHALLDHEFLTSLYFKNKVL